MLANTLPLYVGVTKYFRTLWFICFRLNLNHTLLIYTKKGASIHQLYLYKDIYYKIGLEGFGAPGNLIFDFKPFIFFFKNNKYWSVWQLGQTTSRLITVFYHWANGRSNFKVRELESLLLLKAMQIIMETSTGSFFCSFFIKKWKVLRALKARITCATRFFYFARTSASTADRRHSFQPNFVIDVLIWSGSHTSFLLYCC